MDLHSNSKLDPDPHKTNADPKHWIKHFVFTAERAQKS
jgi:hypothetical protein